jgi:hypothetical protein
MNNKYKPTILIIYDLIHNVNLLITLFSDLLQILKRDDKYNEIIDKLKNIK